MWLLILQPEKFLGMSRLDRVGNEEVRRRARIERELKSRLLQSVLGWFEEVERMDVNVG